MTAYDEFIETRRIMERQILGSIMINNDAYDFFAKYINTDDFVFDEHRELFDLCAREIRANRLATPVTLSALIGGASRLRAVAASEYLQNISASGLQLRDCQLLIDALGGRPAQRMYEDQTLCLKGELS